MDKFNNQFATQKLRQETSMTGTGATFTPGTGEQTAPRATKKVVRKKLTPEEKDVEPKYAAGKAKVYMKDKWGWKDAPSIPNRPSKGGFIYKQLFEELSYTAFNHYRSILNDAYQELNSYNDQEGVKAIAAAYKSLDYTDTIDSIIKLNVAEKAIENSKLVPGQKSTYLTAIDRIREYLIQKSTFKIVDSENTYFGRTAKIHDIHDDGTVMVIIDAPGNPTTTVDIAKLKSISGLNENYSKFKTETKTRGKSDQFHQAVREVRKKVQEINRLFEYVSRLKSELSEGEGGLKYKVHTEKALEKIKEMVSALNQNVKKFK